MRYKNNGEKFDQKEYAKAYQRNTYKTYAFHFDKRTDLDVIDKLKRQENKTEYIRSLVRKDINSDNSQP